MRKEVLAQSLSEGRPTLAEVWGGSHLPCLLCNWNPHGVLWVRGTRSTSLPIWWFMIQQVWSICAVQQLIENFSLPVVCYPIPKVFLSWNAKSGSILDVSMLTHREDTFWAITLLRMTCMAIETCTGLGMLREGLKVESMWIEYQGNSHIFLNDKMVPPQL